MAALYDEENFGSQKLAEMRDETDPNNYKTLITDKKNMKTGHDRVKRKARDIRQEYRIAVTQGTRSGSSRAVCKHWLTNCRTTTFHAKKSDFNNDDEMNDCNEGKHDDGEEAVTQNRDGRAEDILESASDNSPSALNSVEQQRLQIKITNEKTQVQLCKHFLAINVSSLKKISLLLNEIKCSLT